MKSLTAKEGRSRLHRLIDEAAESHIPILIRGKRNSAVLISADDWEAVQEMLYLLSIPGMRKSIRNGMAAPIAECTESLDGQLANGTRSPFSDKN